MTTPHAAIPLVRIIGGGITGLAAALEASRHEGTEVELFESTDRLGGKIATSPFAGLPLDEGPDAFLLRVPEAAELCEEVGVEFTNPAAGHASIYVDGMLKRIPTGLVLGAPAHFEDLAHSEILSPEGLERARSERDTDGMPISGDRSVEEFITQRYGPEVSQRLVEPLIGGIYGGLAKHLSLDAVLPQLSAIAHSQTNCTEPLVNQLAATTSSGPVFGAPVGGLDTVVRACRDTLVDRGVRIHLDAAIDQLDDVPTILATAGPATAQLVATASADAAEMIGSIEWAGVVLVALAFRREDFDVAPDGSGFLVPRGGDGSVTAVSWSSNKWAHLDPGDGTMLVRVSLGHRGDQSPLEWSDDKIVTVVCDELAKIAGLDGPPQATRVCRYPNGFPQYDVGHLELVDRIEAQLLVDAPNVRVTGSTYRGLGIPACIRQGRQAVRHLFAAYESSTWPGTRG